MFGFRSGAFSRAFRASAASARRMSTAAAADEPGWYEPARLGVRWVVIPGGFFASLAVFKTGLTQLANAEAALHPDLLERVEGKIVESGPNGVKFTYEYNGVTYTSSKVLPGEFGDSASLAEKYPSGSSAKVFVNPTSANTGFLEPGDRDLPFAVAFTGGVFTYLFVSAFRCTRNLGFHNLKRALRMGR